MKFILIAIMLVIFNFSSEGQTPDAKEIVRRAENKIRGKTSVATMTIQIVRPDYTREMRVKAWTKDLNYAMILITSPPRENGKVFLKRNKEVWNWIPSIERNIKLPPSMMSQSWMGTDFTNDDLVKESSVIDDYVHNLGRDTILQGRECYRIVMVPKPETAVVWGKLIAYIDKKDDLQLRIEFFDEDGNLVNIMSASEVKILGGKLLPSRIEMVPSEKKGNKTVLIYEFLEFDTPIAEIFFTTGNMKNLK